jgi:hypothetical protein
VLLLGVEAHLRSPKQTWTTGSATKNWGKVRKQRWDLTLCLAHLIKERSATLQVASHPQPLQQETQPVEVGVEEEDRKV